MQKIYGVEIPEGIEISGYEDLFKWRKPEKDPAKHLDIRLAVDSEASYLILSLMDIDNPVLNSFHVENGVSTREELVELDGIADRR